MSFTMCFVINICSFSQPSSLQLTEWRTISGAAQSENASSRDIKVSESVSKKARSTYIQWNITQP